MRERSRSGIRQVASRDNSLVKTFRRALAEGVTREGWVAVEGPHLVSEAVQPTPRANVQSVLVAKGAAGKFHTLLEAAPQQAEITVVPDRLFEQISQMETPQGIAALVEVTPPSFDSILGAPEALLLVACGVQDPGNLGTMLRSAHALGATAMLTLKETVSPFNPKAARASAGAVFHLPIVCGLEAGELIAKAHEKGIRIVGCERASPRSIEQAVWRGPVALFVGAEGSGLDPAIACTMDEILAIPLRPGTDSLNAAIAASIFLYEAARQRRFNFRTIG